MEQAKLLRFTVQEGKIVFDPTDFEVPDFPLGETPGQGRGGYVIPDTDAIAKLPKMKGKIEHFLKCRVY